MTGKSGGAGEDRLGPGLRLLHRPGGGVEATAFRDPIFGAAPAAPLIPARL